ncbi:MAG TPA: hypothetical protein VK303_07820, partial [Desulfobacteria bacterium]|nr:hypothetical protein [Desulfobacteria bacterium]
MPYRSAIAFISNASEMIVPRNRIRSRSRSCRIFRDKVAAMARSSAGYITWAVMSAGIPARTARRKGSSSRRRSVCRPARTTGSSMWESAEVSPWPGKCFPTGRTPRESDPFAKAIP